MEIIQQANGLTKLTYFIGCRWSSEDGESSVADQHTYCERFVNKRGGVIAESVAASGHKGRTMKRPDIAALNKHLAADTIDVILYKDDSRFSRSVRAFMHWLEAELEPANRQRVAAGKQPVLLMFAKDGFTFNSHTQEGHTELLGRILRNEEYSRKSTADIRIMQETKSSEGYWVYQYPFGTRKDYEHPGVPLPDEYWYMVELMFEWFATGQSLYFITQEFLKRAIPTRRKGKWSQGKIRSLLASKFYNPEAGWLHKCVVNAEHYRACQERLARGSEAGRPATKRVYILDGLLTTSHFEVVKPDSRKGEPLSYKGIVTSRRKGKPNHHIYKFRSHTPGHKPYYELKACDEYAERMAMSVPADTIETAVMEALLSNPLECLLVKCAHGRDEAKAQLERQLSIAEKDRRSAGIARRKNYQRRMKALDADATETVKELDSEAAALIAAEEQAILRVQTLTGQLEALPDDQQLRVGLDRLDALDILWSINTLDSRKAVKEILAVIIDSIDLRCDRSGVLRLKLPAVAGVHISTSVAGNALSSARSPADTR